MINGQNHKGSTYHIGKMLADKLEGEVTEFFLPKDFGHFCIGCNQCIVKDEKLCPYYEELKPLTDAVDCADVIILTSPVYVYHCTGSMKAWLDHYGYRWMLHRPNPAMFSKQGVCISTAAGAGMKWTNKDMADSMFFWGMGKIYRYGTAVHALNYKTISPKKMAEIEKATDKLAEKIRKNYGHVKPGLKTKAYFEVMRKLVKNGWNEGDVSYWKEHGWTEKARPWK